ncbi:hypothetical protein E2C01_031026 [Portunus trituberculatus]|uniref:Uncharacterized protein n=1 Tax=Portunus trituberculatus TaxID=210409 RepID=A0A5B7ESI9_PORTR|nr:hypothetical protein [Portunus trituberculatus]
MIVKTPSKTRQATSYRTPRLKTVPWLRVSGQTSAKKRDAKMWSEDLNGLMRRSLKLCNLSSMTNFKFKDEKLRAQYQKALKSKLYHIHTCLIGSHSSPPGKSAHGFPLEWKLVLDAYPSPLVKVKLNVTSCLSWQSSIVDAVWLEVSSLIPGETEAEDKMRRLSTRT